MWSFRSRGKATLTPHRLKQNKEYEAELKLVRLELLATIHGHEESTYDPYVSRELLDLWLRVPQQSGKVCTEGDVGAHRRHGDAAAVLGECSFPPATNSILNQEL
eukprot:3805952-Rhodomonas_salina.1